MKVIGGGKKKNPCIVMEITFFPCHCVGDLWNIFCDLSETKEGLMVSGRGLRKCVCWKEEVQSSRLLFTMGGKLGRKPERIHRGQKLRNKNRMALRNILDERRTVLIAKGVGDKRKPCSSIWSSTAMLFLASKNMANGKRAVTYVALFYLWYSKCFTLFPRLPTDDAASGAIGGSVSWSRTPGEVS